VVRLAAPNSHRRQLSDRTVIQLQATASRSRLLGVGVGAGVYRAPPPPAGTAAPTMPPAGSAASAAPGGVSVQTEQLRRLRPGKTTGSFGVWVAEVTAGVALWGSPPRDVSGPVPVGPGRGYYRHESLVVALSECSA